MEASGALGCNMRSRSHRIHNSQRSGRSSGPRFEIWGVEGELIYFTPLAQSSQSRPMRDASGAGGVAMDFRIIRRARQTHQAGPSGTPTKAAMRRFRGGRKEGALGAEHEEDAAEPRRCARPCRGEKLPRRRTAQARSAPVRSAAEAYRSARPSCAAAPSATSLSARAHPAPRQRELRQP